MHLQEKNFDSFTNGSDSMNTEEMIAFLEHLDSCNFCLEQMLQSEEQQESITAPLYLKEQILKKTSSLDVQTAKAISATSYKMQLLYCGLRTGIGVIAALFLLFFIGQTDFSALQPSLAVQTEVSGDVPDHREYPSHLYRFSQTLNNGISDSSRKLTDYLNDFSNKILNGGK